MSIEQKLAALTEAKIPFVGQTRMVIRISTKGGTVMYYPTTNKWQCSGKNYMGDIASFIAFVRKKQPCQ